MAICRCGHYEDYHNTSGCGVTYCECQRYHEVKTQWKTQAGHNQHMLGKIFGERQGTVQSHPEYLLRGGGRHD